MSAPPGGLRIVYALVCERVLRCVDHRYVATGILNGALAVPAGTGVNLDVLVALSAPRSERVPFQVSVELGGTEMLAQRMDAAFAQDDLHAHVLLERIPVTASSGILVVRLRERRGEWMEATRLRIEATAADLTPLGSRSGPLAS